MWKTAAGFLPLAGVILALASTLSVGANTTDTVNVINHNSADSLKVTLSVLSYPRNDYQMAAYPVGARVVIDYQWRYDDPCNVMDRYWYGCAIFLGDTCYVQINYLREGVPQSDPTLLYLVHHELDHCNGIHHD